jgi:hypothetical protein
MADVNFSFAPKTIIRDGIVYIVMPDDSQHEVGKVASTDPLIIEFSMAGLLGDESDGTPPSYPPIW